LIQLREIGTIVRLQIQRSPLKVGQKPHRVYDTSPLLSVSSLRVSPDGVIALLPDNQTAIDVHHAHHPHSQNAGPNGVSIGFTPNYAGMRERFGDHMTDGCAGENILIETGESLEWSDVERGVMIRCSAAGADLWLGDILVAQPCVEFSRYTLRMPEVEKGSLEIRQALQFLEHGTRGFYATPSNHGEPLVVSIGDRVYLPQ